MKIARWFLVLSSLFAGCNVEVNDQEYTFYGHPYSNDYSWVHKNPSGEVRKIRRVKSEGRIDIDADIYRGGKKKGRWELDCVRTEQGFYDVSSSYYSPEGELVRSVDGFPKELGKIFATHPIGEKEREVKKTLGKYFSVR